MMKALVLSLPSLAWALLLCLALLYITCITILLGVVVRLQNETYVEGNFGSHEGLTMYWKTLPLSLISLFQSATGGLDWGEVWQSMETLHFGYKIIFLGYIAGMLFAMMNI